MEGLELKHYLDAFKYKVPCRLSRIGLFNLDLEYPDHRYNEIGVITDLSTYNDGKEISGSIKLKSGVSVDFGFLLGEEPEIELIYRPLSYLTKEIEANGEKFIPLVKLAKIAIPEFYKNKYYSIKVIGDFGEPRDFHYILPDQESFIVYTYDDGYPSFKFSWNGAVNQMELFEKLFEWHFDVFGLIEQGLAKIKTS